MNTRVVNKSASKRSPSISDSLEIMKEKYFVIKKPIIQSQLLIDYADYISDNIHFLRKVFSELIRQLIDCKIFDADITEEIGDEVQIYLDRIYNDITSYPEPVADYDDFEDFDY